MAMASAIEAWDGKNWAHEDLLEWRAPKRLYFLISGFLNRDLGHPDLHRLNDHMPWLVPVSAMLSVIMALYLATLDGPRRRSYRWLSGAMGLLAVLISLTGLVVPDGGPAIGLARPVLAMGFPPLLFLHVRTLSKDEPVRAVWHLAGPGLVGGIVLLGIVTGTPTGTAIDLALLVGSLAYAVACTRQVDPEQAPSTRRWIRIVGAWLATMALADLIVALELLGNKPASESLGLAIALAGLVGFLSYFLVSSLHQVGPVSWMMARLKRAPSGSLDDLDRHMRVREAWRDPDLTVARIGRQISWSQRQVSECVNSQAGQSVSNWINTYRAAEAKRLMVLTPDRPLVELCLDCGFQTRSNFNRAFKDITGMSPSAWRKANKKDRP